MTDAEYAVEIREHIREINKLIEESGLVVRIDNDVRYKLGTPQPILVFKADIQRRI